MASIGLAQIKDKLLEEELIKELIVGHFPGASALWSLPEANAIRMRSRVQRLRAIMSKVLHS